MVGCPAIEGRERSSLIEKGEVAFEASAHGGHGLARVDIHVFVFHRAPEAFDEVMVAPAAAPVQADLDVMPTQDIDKRDAGEWRSLIGSVLKISGAP